MHNPWISLIRAVWQHGKPWHRAIAGYYIAYIVAQGLMSLSPYAFGKAIGLLQHFSQGSFRELLFWLIFGVLLVPLFWLFHGPARVVERKVALRIQQSFRLKIFADMTRLPLKWHQDHHSGHLVTRVNRAATALHRFAEDQFIYIETVVKFIVSVGFLLWISLPVGLVSLVSCSLATWVVFAFDRKLIPLYESENETDNQVGALFFDYLNNMTTILTLRLGKLTEKSLIKRILSIWPVFNQEVVLNEVKWFAMGITLSALQSAILIGYIVWHLENFDAVLVGTVVMIFRYQWDLSEVFYNFSANYSDLVRKDTDIRGVQPILDDIHAHALMPVDIDCASSWQTLEIADLNFHHPGSKRSGSLEGLHFTLQRGEKIALIGTSGAGKSTLMNLLSGLYHPDSVRLRMDNHTFANLVPLQALTTLIPQEPEIFENTIAFNIALGLETSSEELLQAVKLAGFSEVLSTLPQGLETDIREKGVNLSVGQKQRLALARGLFAARFSSLVLMDEPTSSVDLAAEKAILTGVMERFRDATMLVSLHRLHLLPQFDRVICLSHGKIIADGATADLLNTEGPVRDVWQKYQSHRRSGRV
ncbi:ATP-binding transmembrane ABC transporter [Legionella geestiana]|uniref:ATP-binding transmembrane ABC transporter n=1 Tax=Legionella geestiana TaxID=45065 RepID=A0A0W0TJS8_9GAMM|nr:ABC transporter ATP-binding protein [Legionella geestiana]KTC95846.1 ATP-binding transmembrane ABC transporter [Legionella geestiana]QBS13258.1 ABC transporter ATP-binding protein [Legionella geestiana]STX54216.1 ATP-binding transmembrane ABC transporter [Legionella geestiana]